MSGSVVVAREALPPRSHGIHAVEVHKSRQLPTVIEWARKAMSLLDNNLSPRATPCRGKATDAIRVAIDLLEAVYGLDESNASLSPTRHGS